MIEASRRLQQVKRESGQAIRIFSVPTEERWALIGCSNAALQNRIDRGRTKGLLFTCSSVRALQGEEPLMSVISWRSGRTDRVGRSATCAETRAIVGLEGELFAMRDQWSEMLGNSVIGNSQVQWHDWYLAHVWRTARDCMTKCNTR